LILQQRWGLGKGWRLANSGGFQGFFRRNRFFIASEAGIDVFRILKLINVMMRCDNKPSIHTPKANCGECRGDKPPTWLD